MSIIAKFRISFINIKHRIIFLSRKKIAAKTILVDKHEINEVNLWNNLEVNFLQFLIF